MKNFGHNPVPDAFSTGRGITVAETNSVEPSTQEFEKMARRRSAAQLGRVTPAAMERGKPEDKLAAAINRPAPGRHADIFLDQGNASNAPEFWQRRASKRLGLSDVREIQSNLEGLIGVLTEWDAGARAEANSVVKLLEQDGVNEE